MSAGFNLDLQNKRLRSVAKATTITSIARELNIAPATVSRALRDHPRISAKTKKTVNKLADELNFKTNKIASSLRSGKTHMIGVIVPSAKISFFGSVVHGIEMLANAHGYNVLIYQSNESHHQEVKGIDTLLAARVDGILVSIAKDTVQYTHFAEAQKRDIPLVFFDRANDTMGIPSVVIDDYHGAYIATEHLIQQGYERIAYVMGPQNIKVFSDRFRGYLGALQANNRKIRKDFIFPGNVSVESGIEAAHHLLCGKIKPDAIFAAEDFTALGVIKELRKNNIKVGPDFGVFGFANEFFGELISPTLSTIDQQTVNMGKEAFTMLLQFIEQKEVALAIHKKIVLQPIPIFRESSLRR